MTRSISRRSLLAATAGACLAAPQVMAQTQVQAAARPGEGWVLPEDFVPRVVQLRGDYAPGEIHVDPNVFALYFTIEGNQAIRYVVGIAKGDLYESGVFRIGAKREWPTWKPTPEMIERNPRAYGRWRDAAMPGGPDNPLGARALYLFTPTGGDTMLRIHGTPQPWTVGTAVSNGCVRLVNDQISELYTRVALESRAVLYPKTAS